MLRLLCGTVCTFLTLAVSASDDQARPNILIAMADDQSFPHTSFAGYEAVQTPGFDRVAREGVYIKNAFAPSPGCSPTRAALLTGRHPWQIEQAGTHASSFPAKYVVFPDLLENAGYSVGMTGKGWGPGDFQAVDQRPRNPAGPEFQKHKCKPPTSGISKNDYAANFADFFNARDKSKPFCFWYGSTEPHREYELGSGLKAGKESTDAKVPDFLPDTPEIRSDLLDYCLEIEWFDSHLVKMLTLLEEAGELDNTMVIVTADNGMPFPRAKANLYDYGFHEPLAIRWGKAVPGGRVVDDLIGFVDLTATILDATNVAHPSTEFPISGRSFLEVLKSNKQGIVDPSRDAVFAARERHSSSRYNNWTYPQRAIRTQQHLYIRNFRPDRWPAGDPVTLKQDGTLNQPHSGYHDIDACPTLDFLISKADDPILGKYLPLSVAKRPSEELFDIVSDPACLKNLADDPEHLNDKWRLSKRLIDYLTESGDARALDGGEIWETYPRYSPIRSFPAPDEGSSSR